MGSSSNGVDKLLDLDDCHRYIIHIVYDVKIKQDMNYEITIVYLL